MGKSDTIRRCRRVLPALLSAGAALGGAGASSPAAAQVSPPSLEKAAPLRTFVLPDRTALIRLPADWQVVQTGVAFIRARGPNGELAMFGIAVPAHDGAGTPVTRDGLNQPYSAALEEKFTQSMGWVLAKLGRNAVPIKIIAETGFKAPAAFGTCANYTMLLGPNAGIAAEADFCSLPMDKAGDYKNFFKIVGLGAGQAKRERKMLEAILGSYELNMTAIRQQLAQGSQAPGMRPPSPMPGMQGGGQNPAAAMAGLQQQQLSWQLAQMQTNAIMSSTNNMMASSLRSADTFDRSILRDQTPVYADGGSNPLFWISD